MNISKLSTGGAKIIEELESEYVPHRTNPSNRHDLESHKPTNSEPSVKFLNVTQTGAMASDTPYFKLASPNAANHTKLSKMSRSNMSVTSH